MLMTLLPQRVAAVSVIRRRRPSDPSWPSQSAWDRLDREVGGRLIPVTFPLSADSDASQLWKNLRNPYFIGGQPGLTQTLGWVDAWATQPSVYAVAAANANDIAAAVNFARANDLRVVVRGGGHSYQGTSNAPDSLMIWTRHMNSIELHDAFVPHGCEHLVKPQPAVTVGTGAIWMQAYDAVTTKAGKYVQGGGCTTVGVAGLIQSGGFGSFSKRYGLAAGSLLEAEVVTADGKIRIANAAADADLFWALKGGGGGTFGVVSRVTLRLHDLPEYFGVASFTVEASSESAYRRLITGFLNFYRGHLFNDHWGEQARFTTDNKLVISMVSQGLNTAQMRQTWRPFFDWLATTPTSYSIKGHLTLASLPARHFWDPNWWRVHWPEIGFPPDGNPFVEFFDHALAYLPWQPVFDVDKRPGSGPDNVWWAGDADQVGWFIWGYESLWLNASLLDENVQPYLADALFAASRESAIALHFNKGLAGAPDDAIAAAKDTAINPAALTAFALVIAAYGQEPAYPGIAGHLPSVDSGRIAARRIDRAMGRLRAMVKQSGSYVSESNFFEKDWQRAYWGGNYSRLAEIKRRYDPDGLFVVHNGVGSEGWSADGFTRR